MANNGMGNYSIHAANRAQLDEIRALKEECTTLGYGVDAGAEAVDPETAARQHLAVALDSANLPEYSRPAVEGLEGGFKLLGTETIELTGTTTVKFRQTFNKVPVYGSLVTVELDDANNLIGLNSALGTPEGVSPTADIAPSAVLEAIGDAGGVPDPNAPVRPLYYFDRRAEPPRWRLCYLVEDVPLAEPEGGYETADEDEPHGVGRLPAPTENFFVDAHSGEIVARLPRSADASAPPVAQVSALDELDTPRTIRVSPQDGAMTRLYDPLLNIHTFDHGFADAALSTLPDPTYCLKSAGLGQRRGQRACQRGGGLRLPSHRAEAPRRRQPGRRPSLEHSLHLPPAGGRHAPAMAQRHVAQGPDVLRSAELRPAPLSRSPSISRSSPMK